MLIGAVDEWRRWALFTVPDVGEWSEGAIALLGDAAHAMLPFAAQGAGMAIEDAAVLAKALSDSAGENTAGIPAALKRYGRLRRARVRSSARRAAQRDDLSPHRPVGAGARPHHQGDGTETRAGTAGLDLRLAGVAVARPHSKTPSSAPRCRTATASVCLWLAPMARPAPPPAAALFGTCCAARLPQPALIAPAPRCIRCDKQAPPPRVRQPRFPPLPSGPAILRRGS